MAFTLQQLEDFVKRHRHFQDLSARLVQYLILTSTEYVENDIFYVDANKRVTRMPASFVTDTDGATITFNFNNGLSRQVTLGGNRTLAFSNAKNGFVFYIKLIQDATGSRTVTWPSTVDWEGGTAPTLTTAANAVDLFRFSFDGTDFFGETVGLNFS